MVSQKCQYALRAVFELAKRSGQGPVKIGEIARAQAIPLRFLEVILGQLKQSGLVESRRGSEGGYLLPRAAAEISVGEVIRFIEPPMTPAACAGSHSAEACAIHAHCVFTALWDRVRERVSEVYDGTTFQDLIEQEARMSGQCSPSYVI